MGVGDKGSILALSAQLKGVETASSKVFRVKVGGFLDFW